MKSRYTQKLRVNVITNHNVTYDSLLKAHLSKRKVLGRSQQISSCSSLSCLGGGNDPKRFFVDKNELSLFCNYII